MDPVAEIAAYKASVNANVTTKVTIDSITPVDVGDEGTDLAGLILPYLQIINNQGITYGTGLPSPADGEDLDLYYRINGTTFYLYRKELGVWVPKVELTFGYTIPDGPLTIRASISGFDVTVIPGAWAIDNVIYTKATPTFITANPADLNFDRYDLIYADTAGNVSYLAGTAASSPSFPATPANSIAVDYVIVPSSSSGNNPYLFYAGAGSTNNSAGILVTGTSDASGNFDTAVGHTLREFPAVTIYVGGEVSTATYSNTTKIIQYLPPSTAFTARFI